jgi:hypothetical protein
MRLLMDMTDDDKGSVKLLAAHPSAAGYLPSRGEKVHRR